MTATGSRDLRRLGNLSVASGLVEGEGKPGIFHGGGKQSNNPNDIYKVDFDKWVDDNFAYESSR